MTSMRHLFGTALLAGALGPAQAFVALDHETFTDAGSFLATTGLVAFESFESLSARVRGSGPVVTAGFSVTPLDPALLGVQNGPESPETGYGTAPTHGSNYLFSYLPPEPGSGALRAPGTLRFDFLAPVTAFGIHLVDVGEAPGTISLRTNAGGLSGGETLLEFAGGGPNGAVSFVGVVQLTAFTSLSLTVNGLDEAFGLDQAYIQAVPEPHQAALLAVGLLPLIALARRRRAD